MDKSEIIARLERGSRVSGRAVTAGVATPLVAFIASVYVLTGFNPPLSRPFLEALAVTLVAAATGLVLVAAARLTTRRDVVGSMLIGLVPTVATLGLLLLGIGGEDIAMDVAGFAIGSISGSAIGHATGAALRDRMREGRAPSGPQVSEVERDAVADLVGASDGWRVPWFVRTYDERNQLGMELDALLVAEHGYRVTETKEPSAGDRIIDFAIALATDSSMSTVTVTYVRDPGRRTTKPWRDPGGGSTTPRRARGVRRPSR